MIKAYEPQQPQHATNLLEKQSTESPSELEAYALLFLLLFDLLFLWPVVEVAVWWAFWGERRGEVKIPSSSDEK